MPRTEFDYNEKWRKFFKDFADKKFGKDVVSYNRLDSLFNSKATSHIMLFTDSATKEDIGVVVLFLEQEFFAFYYYFLISLLFLNFP